MLSVSQAITCLPANDTAAVEAAIHGLPLSDTTQHGKVSSNRTELGRVLFAS